MQKLLKTYGIAALLSTSITATAETIKEVTPKEKKDDGFTLLFNGKNFDGWYLKIKNNDEELAKRVFTVENGMVHVFNDSFPDEIDLNKGTDDTIGMMYTKKEYSKYHLKFEYKMTKSSQQESNTKSFTTIRKTRIILEI